MNIAIVFDHPDVYDMGASAREKGEPRQAPTSAYNFADDESKAEFERSWLQGWDSHDAIPPWLQCVGCSSKCVEGSDFCTNCQ